MDYRNTEICQNCRDILIFDEPETLFTCELCGYRYHNKCAENLNHCNPCESVFTLSLKAPTEKKAELQMPPLLSAEESEELYRKELTQKYSYLIGRMEGGYDPADPEMDESDYIVDERTLHFLVDLTVWTTTQETNPEHWLEVSIDNGESVDYIRNMFWEMEATHPHYTKRRY